MDAQTRQDDALPPRPEQETDAASRSLADALGLGFRVLQYVMLVLVVVFAFSGWFNVREGEVVVRIRFGRLLGLPGEQVLGPGGPYFAWPSPIDEVIRIPTTAQRLSIDRAFWFAVAPEDEAKKLDELSALGNSLVPGRDGSLLTGDQNIVHGRWTVIYQIRPEDAVAFACNVGTLEQAERTVSCAAEQTIVQATARASADDFVRGQLDRTAARRNLQKVLDRLNAGIAVTELLLNQPTPPLAVRGAFLEVSQAESEKAEKIEAAEREWSRVHNEVAGPAHRILTLAIGEYEKARRTDDAKAKLLEQVIDRLLDGARPDQSLQPWLSIESDLQVRELMTAYMTGDRVGGTVSQVIHEARSHRTQVVARVRAEADRFLSLLPMFRQNPQLVLDRLWRDARQEILCGDVETIYLPDDRGKSLLLEINRDPAVRKKREQESYRLSTQGGG